MEDQRKEFKKLARKKKNFYDEDLNKIPVCIEPDEPFYGWHLDEYQLEFVLQIYLSKVEDLIRQFTV